MFTLNFNFIEICSQWFNWQQISIGWGSELVPSRRQAIMWTTNVDRVTSLQRCNFKNRKVKHDLTEISLSLSSTPVLTVSIDLIFILSMSIYKLGFSFLINNKLRIKYENMAHISEVVLQLKQHTDVIYFAEFRAGLVTSGKSIALLSAVKYLMNQTPWVIYWGNCQGLDSIMLKSG